APYPHPSINEDAQKTPDFRGFLWAIIGGSVSTATVANGRWPSPVLPAGKLEKRGRQKKPRVPGAFGLAMPVSRVRASSQSGAHP
ncbi:MAG: hypothetical protein RBR91_02930, partial [Porticoccaceae bacterium]|nr:hypothetical protein [Porticoccaceae bacterium]